MLYRSLTFFDFETESQKLYCVDKVLISAFLVRMRFSVESAETD